MGRLELDEGGTVPNSSVRSTMVLFGDNTSARGSLALQSFEIVDLPAMMRIMVASRGKQQLKQGLR